MSLLLVGALVALGTAVVVARDAWSSPRKIVVYYANETTDRAYNSENYQKLFDILGQSRNPAAAEIMAALRSEMTEFTAAVQKDTAALLQAAKAQGFDLIIFTNALALDGHFNFYSASEGRVETRRFPDAPAPQDPVLEYSPLARATVFQATLEEAASLYPAGTPDAVLITNSHGTPDMALMPRVNIDLSSVAPEEVLRLFDGDDQFERPPWAALRGTDKVAYWEILGEVSEKTQMQFALVLRLACQSGLASWREYRAIPESVRLIGHTAEYSIAVGAFDAAGLFGGNETADWFDVLTSQLEKQDVYINSRAALSLWLVLVALRWPPAWAYFVPLGLWLCWMVLRARRRHLSHPRIQRSS
jgi:hypothetical protein